MSIILKDGKLIESVSYQQEIDIVKFDADTAAMEAEIARLQGLVVERKAKRSEMEVVAPDIAKPIAEEPISK